MISFSTYNKYSCGFRIWIWSVDQNAADKDFDIGSART